MRIRACGEPDPQRVRGVVARKPSPSDGALYGPSDRTRVNALVLNHYPCDHAKQRSCWAPYPPDPGLERADGTRALGASEGDLGTLAQAELIFLTVSHIDDQALRMEGDVGHVEPGELACAKCAGEAEQQHGAVALVAERASEHGDDLGELVLEQRDGTLFARAVHTSDASFEGADAGVLVRPRLSRVAVREANRPYVSRCWVVCSCWFLLVSQGRFRPLLT
jgi:hypothetical protein